MNEQVETVKVSKRQGRPTWEHVLGAVGNLETRLASETFFQVLRNKGCAARLGHENEDLPTAFTRHELWAIETAADALSRTEDFVEMARPIRMPERMRLRDLRRRLESEVGR